MPDENHHRSMRLLVLAEDFYPNVSGGAHARFRFCELAAEEGQDITVFTPKRKGTKKRETVKDIDIRRPFPAKPAETPAYATLAIFTRILYSVVLFGFLLWWLRGRDFDGIHSASHSMHWVGKVLSLVYGVPLVTFIGYTPSANGSFSLQPDFIRERINFRLFMGSRVFCRSSNVASVVRRSSGSKVDVIHGILNTARVKGAIDGFDEAEIRHRFDVPSDNTFLVYVGRLVPIKNPRGGIDVLSSLPDNYSLVVVGDGPLESEIEEYAQQATLGSRVTFAGRLPHEKTLQCIAAADWLILPSHEEAYPTAVFEALALGNQVVATRVGVLTEITHERLHLGEISEFPAIIEAETDHSKRGLDEGTLDRYSMERYTDQILSAFEELTRVEQ